MRTRLMLGLMSALALLLLGAGSASAQGGGGGANPETGARNTPEGADMTALHYDSGDPGDAGSGQSGGDLDITCTWNVGGREVSEAELNELLAREQVEDPDTEHIEARQVCFGPNGDRLGDPDEDEDPDQWPPDDPDAPPVDPYALAIEAHNSITLPVPHIATSPPISDGSYATLPTYLNIQNWDQGPLTASATAGPVTVTVEANPVEAEWIIQDSVRGTEERVICAGPGSLDGAADDCVWTPEHSSDGQPPDNPWTDEGTGEPCFYAEVYFTWSMTWSVNGTEQVDDPLDDGVTAGSTCIVVAEVQAVVDDA